MAGAVRVVVARSLMQQTRGVTAAEEAGDAQTPEPVVQQAGSADAGMVDAAGIAVARLRREAEQPSAPVSARRARRPTPMTAADTTNE